MIQQDRFLGICLVRRRNRRLLVVGYYALVLGLTWLPLAHGVAPMALLGYLPQAVLLGGVLGGLMYGGVVKPYSDGVMLNRNPKDLEPISLGLEGVGRQESQVLDERETMERDRAHFVAYRILLGLMVVSMVAVWGMAGTSVVLAQRAVPLLVWVLVVSAFSLPQCVILWTERDGAGELALV